MSITHRFISPENLVLIERVTGPLIKDPTMAANDGVAHIHERTLNRIIDAAREEGQRHGARLLWGAAYQNQQNELVIADWAMGPWHTSARLRIMRDDSRGATIVVALDPSSKDFAPDA